MSSYFSSLTSSSAFSNLSTRFTSLRRAISSGEEIDDPENEDLSHISNVLRAYYTEKGRRLPPWLPPDKKHPAASAPALVTSASLHGYNSSSNTPLSPTPSRGGGLADLWGDSPSQTPQSQTSSLRLVRSANSSQQGPVSHLKTSSANHPPLHHTKSSNAVLETSGARPLPSQRLGSYQASQAAAAAAAAVPPAGGQHGGGRLPDRTLSGASAQERLRARLGKSSAEGGGLSRKPVGGSPFGR
ncbi:hypothetical protein VTO42DRAFT_8071 [Malbranchea cinnamomea]